MKILALTLGTMLLIPTFASAQQFGWKKQSQNAAKVGNENCNCESCRSPKKFCRIPGVNGYPYQDPIHNGCKCDRPCKKRNIPEINPHWPSPFANMEKYTHPNCAPGKRPRDVFDVLANVKLIHFKRRDNGYRGLYCDPHGKLGQSLTGVYQPHQKYQPQNLGPAPGSPPKKNRDSVANKRYPLSSIR